jgi:hypothetical protein
LLLANLDEFWDENESCEEDWEDYDSDEDDPFYIIFFSCIRGLFEDSLSF